jgi:hypothetical protein
MRLENTFAELFGGSSLRAAFVAANAATKVLMESLMPKDANRLLCKTRDERELFERLVVEIENFAGKKTSSLAWTERKCFINSLDSAITYTTRKQIGTNLGRAKRGLISLRKVPVDLV